MITTKSPTVNVLGVNISQVDKAQAICLLHDFLKRDRPHLVITPNPEIVIKATRDPVLMSIINTADLVVPDGIGVVVGAKLLGNPLPERVPGYELTQALFASSVTLSEPLTVYLLGGKPGVAAQAGLNLSQQYANLTVVGTHSGYFDTIEEAALLRDIERTRPQVLIVGLGAPKQEKWLHQHRHLPIKIGIGAGGSIDVFAGQVQRAPERWIKLNLEWLYRLLKQPQRLFRMGSLVRFILRISYQALKTKKNK